MTEKGNPPHRLEIALAQINPVVGDLVGNADLMIAQLAEAKTRGAQLVLFPELAISGYPPEDLVLREDFLVATSRQLERIAATATDIVGLVGYPQAHPAGVGNSLAVLADGELVTSYRKQLLPNYGVFDERRYFIAGDQNAVIDVGGIPVGLSVCEDVWFDDPVYSGSRNSAHA